MSSLMNEAGWDKLLTGFRHRLVSSLKEIRFQPQRRRIAALIRLDVFCRLDLRAHSTAAAAARAASDPQCERSYAVLELRPAAQGPDVQVGGDLRLRPITDPRSYHGWNLPRSSTSQSLIPMHRGRDLPLASKANPWFC